MKCDTGKRSTPSAPPNTLCLEKLVSEVEMDVTRIVGVFLFQNLDTFGENAGEAGRRSVEKERISAGEGIVEPVASNVQLSVAQTFENLSWEIKRSIQVFIDTALKRLCALQNCCFTNRP